MRKILVLNPKGGCGKSTIATNIAGYLSINGQNVAMADFDPQKSTEDWISRRPTHVPKISIANIKGGKIAVPRKTDTLIIDTPAASHGKKLANFVKTSETMVIPLLPSEIDIRAAERFVDELFSLKKLINRKIKLVTVANRVREDTLSAAKLDYFLNHMKLPGGRKLPFITVFRNSQNYIKAAEKGLSIFEFAPAKTTYDREQWKPLMSWLMSQRSLPG
ncbi:MAG: ParA family protein [Gammaproteobacteria bacterium]|nr:ParA family protein [Gammaproteobacteria bacterium]